jgi:CRISPR/Cas system CMR-associated protein Cmr5 small subunit
MYQRTIENLLPYAVDAIIQHKSRMEKNDQIERKYNGYLASFGPSVITAGLHQTVLFYSDKKKANDQGVINKIIFDVLKRMEWDERKTSLADYVVHATDPKKKRKILDIVIACKIALRTFAIEE